MTYSLQKLVLIEAEMKREGHSPRVGLTEPSMGQNHQGSETSDPATVSSGLVSPLGNKVDSRNPRSMTGHLILVPGHRCSQICDRRMLIAFSQSSVVLHNLCLFPVPTRNYIARNLDSFRICQELYAPYAVICTWILVASEVVFLLFGAAVLAGLMSPPDYPEGLVNFAGLFWSCFFLALFVLGLLTSALGALSWF